MQLNQTTLRGILAAILSVDQKYIVPKQGNWWNPQKSGANIANWCAYKIKSNQPRCAPFYAELKTGVNETKNCVVSLKKAVIELQFVGPDSEQLAQSVAMWPLRSDVRAQFESVQGNILQEDLTAISSDFYQDGDNTVVAWNIPQLSVLWYDVLQTNQSALKTIDIGGQVNV